MQIKFVADMKAYADNLLRILYFQREMGTNAAYPLYSMANMQHFICLSVFL